jgi:hypothetical protein
MPSLENEIQIVVCVFPRFFTVTVGFFGNEQKFLAGKRRLPHARPACRVRRPSPPHFIGVAFVRAIAPMPEKLNHRAGAELPSLGVNAAFFDQAPQGTVHHPMKILALIQHFELSSKCAKSRARALSSSLSLIFLKPRIAGAVRDFSFTFIWQCQAICGSS